MSVDRAFPRFVSYIDKSREFYAASGYDKAYRWAYNEGRPPFSSLPAALSTLRLGLVTTTFPRAEPGAAIGPKVPYAEPVNPKPQGRFTDDLAWDKDATHTEDTESYLPIERMQEQVAAGRIGSLAPRFYGVPTEYSPRRTIEQDAPAVLELLRQDQVDVALLAPL